MFGSDFPNQVESGIQTIVDAPFLSAEQKASIVCDHAARFLRLAADVCAPRAQHRAACHAVLLPHVWRDSRPVSIQPNESGNYGCYSSEQSANCVRPPNVRR
jgi:hypothetical protein